MQTVKKSRLLPLSDENLNPASSQRDGHEAILLWLTLLKDCTAGNILSTRRSFTYAGIGDFLLQHGKWYENVRLAHRLGLPRACFRNAAMEAASHRGWRYVEGYAAIDVMEVHHAWVVDENDQPIEVTWKTPGLAYLGVEFPMSRVLECGGCVLDPVSCNYRVYEEPWKA